MASSRYFSSITQRILISAVLMPASQHEDLEYFRRCSYRSRGHTTIRHRCKVYQLGKLPSFDSPSAISLNRVIHGIGGKIGPVRPLHRAQHNSDLSKGGRIA